MLRLLSIRNFVVVDALDLELDGGFSVLTGETGAGKSILLDALALLLGDRFETRQLKPGADRAELAASFDVGERPDVIEWLDGEGLATDDGTLLVRRTLDAQGRSRGAGCAGDHRRTGIPRRARTRALGARRDGRRMDIAFEHALAARACRVADRGGRVRRG